MKLKLAPRLEQQQVLAPQMILSMDILLLNSLDLEQRIEKELVENPALELEEVTPPEEDNHASEGDPEVTELLELLDTFQSRYGGDDEIRPRAASSEEDAKHEALQNHADREPTLVEYIQTQLGYLDLDPGIEQICGEIAGNIDERGYLSGDLEEIALSSGVPEALAQKALELVQTLDPAGLGARDLRECLLLQLGENDELERRIVGDHLQDLLENRLPRIAERVGVSLAEVKEAVEVIALLDPYPGRRFHRGESGRVIPEIFVDEIDNGFKVRIEEGMLPTLRISPTCSAMLREDGQNPKVVEFVRRKVEAARWLIHAIDQRRRTLADIAQAIVDHQVEFFQRGPGNIASLTMQTIADQVGVHISTVSRATNGKYIQSPYGVIELRRFFTGGVERADGGIESRENVCSMIREIVEEEDPRRPLSDSQLTKKLQERGLGIARRTVSKYRERAGVPPARLRKKH